MQDTILQLIQDFGYLAVFFLIFIENVVPPIPSEVVLLFSGAMTVHTGMNPVSVVLSATAGSLAGALLLYALGRVLKTDRIRKLFSGRFAEVTHLKGSHVDRAISWFSRYQTKAVFFGRFVPIIRSLISIPAGIAEMNVPLFLILTTMGSAIWNAVLVCVGVFLGDAWGKALPYMKEYSILILGLCAIGGAIFLYRRWKRKKS